jgi:acyl-CoA synthetase (AMP-forming)/AMP-acid ligase II
MSDAPLELAFAPLPYPEEYGEERFESLPDQVRRNAAARPDAPAIREIGAPGRDWTRAEAAARMDAGAARLLSGGLPRGGVVALLADAPAEGTLGYLAGLAAGGCVAPMPAMAADATLRTMLADGPARALVASADTRARAEAILDGAPGLAGVPRYALDFEAPGWTPLFGGPAPEAGALPAPGPDDPFNIIYSSGTTGVPKGIVHDHRFRVRQLPRLVAQGIEDGGGMILSTPLYSNTTLVAVFAALSAGCALAYQRKFDAQGWLAEVEGAGLTNTMLVPVLVNRLLGHAPRRWRRRPSGTCSRAGPAGCWRSTG